MRSGRFALSVVSVLLASGVASADCTRVDASVDLLLRSSTQSARASGVVTCYAANDTVNFEGAFAGNLSIHQINPSTDYSTPIAGSGEWIGTLEAPAIFSYKTCYQALISASSGAASRSASSAELCTPDPPPPPGCLDLSGCTGGGGTTCIPSELNSYCADLNQQPPGDSNPGGGSPIVIHLGGGDYRFSGIDDGVLFDIAASGVSRPVGWTARGSSDAFLALDRNGNGAIDSGAELFGNHTPYPNGTIAANGFDALRQYDSNGDGVLDARDPIWHALVLWNDRDHDGRSTPDELVPIEQSGVAAISLGYHWSGRHDSFGNQFRYQGEVLVSDGPAVRHQPVYDIYFVMR